MSRRAADATRFTSTSPQAIPRSASTSQSPSTTPSQHVRQRLQERGRSSITGSTIEIPATAAPANETPHQKVARLRAAARQAKLDQETNLDRAIARGRVVADFLHRWTVRSLLFLSGMLAGLCIIYAQSVDEHISPALVASIGIAGYSTFDMLVYNRRKRREWLAQQQAAYETALARAMQARDEGTLTSDQALILNKELALQQADEENKNAKSLARRGKDWLFSGLQREEQRGGRLGVGLAAGARKEGIDATNDAVPTLGVERIGSSEPFLSGINEPQGASAATSLPSGGPLDQMGNASAKEIENQARSWFSWLRRSGDSR